MTEVRPYLSIIIPAYNEAGWLPRSLHSITSYLQQQSYTSEIIVVNDGSTDQTVATIKDFTQSGQIRLITYRPNRGKGAAIQQGVLAAQGELIFFLDADLSTPISEVTKLLAAMAEGADLAIGTRAALDSQIEIYQPRYRQVVGKIGNWLIRKLLSIPFLDTQCGFKIFKRSVAQQLFADLMFPGWSFDFEIVYKAYHSGLIIREVPVRWSHQVNSKFSPLFNSLACFLDLLYLRLILPQRKLIKP